MPDPSPEQITLTLNRADAEDINFEGFENASDGAAARFHESLDAALSLEGEDKCERCVWTGESPCPSCHGRGGRTESVTGHPVYGESLPGLVEATAAPSGARGADLEGAAKLLWEANPSRPEWRLTTEANREKYREIARANTGTAPQRPKADPKDHSCHDECACQNGGHPKPDFVAPVPQTEGEDK